MKFIVQCPHCQNQFTVEDNWAGQITTCPICGKDVRVPSPPPQAEPVFQRSSGFQEECGESHAGEACGAFFLTALCCLPVGLALAINTHFKMQESNNHTGRFWLILTYIYSAIYLVGTILVMVFKERLGPF